MLLLLHLPSSFQRLRAKFLVRRHQSYQWKKQRQAEAHAPNRPGHLVKVGFNTKTAF